MDKYIKRIQSKLTYRGQSATKQQCREAYQAIVKNATAPTDAEIDLVVAQLAKSVQAEITDSMNLVPAIAQQEELEITPPSITEITPESHPVEENGGLTIAGSQPLAASAMSVSEESHPVEENSGLTIAGSQPLAASAISISEQQIQIAVRQQFADRPDDIKAQVIQYASQLAFGSAKEMEQMLQQLRETELSVMMQVISTHNTDRSQTLKAFQEALDKAEQSRKEQSSDFFAQFNRQMAEMKAAFGV